MSKVTFALGSFIVGALCGSVSLSLVRASTRAQEPQQTSGSQVPSSVINMPGAIPVVPPLQYFGHGDKIGGSAQQLDSFSCDGCTVSVGLLTYSGGAYSFNNTTFPRGVPLHLDGAALNTLRLLVTLGVVAIPSSPRPPFPGTPPVIQAELQIKASPKTVTFISLEGTKK